MWWIWWMDPEDAGKVAFISLIIVGLLGLGYWIWGPDESQCNDKKTKYDTIQNDSVVVLKKKGHYVYDTVGKTDSTIVLKRRMIYE